MSVQSQYSNPADNVYAIRNLPCSAEWGKGIQDRILYHDARPLRVRVPGRVRSTWFYDRAGQPQARVNIGISVNVAGDEDAVQAMYGRARPRSCELLTSTTTHLLTDTFSVGLGRPVR